MIAAAAPTTKERILEAAEEIMLQKSFHSVGLTEILSAVKVPKGSFYHYFESKEQFGIELLRHYVGEASASRRAALLGNETIANPLERLLAYFQACIDGLSKSSCRCSCLVVKLASEVTTFSDGMREVLADGVHEWSSHFKRVVQEGQKQGVIRRELNAAQTGALLQDLWIGAMQRTQIERSVAPLKGVVTFAREYLRPA